jgi:hypothetical protein
MLGAWCTYCPALSSGSLTGTSSAPAEQGAGECQLLQEPGGDGLDVLFVHAFGHRQHQLLRIVFAAAVFETSQLLRQVIGVKPGKAGPGFTARIVLSATVVLVTADTYRHGAFTTFGIAFGRMGQGGCQCSNGRNGKDHFFHACILLCLMMF